MKTTEKRNNIKMKTTLSLTKLILPILFLAVAGCATLKTAFDKAKAYESNPAHYQAQIDAVVSAFKTALSIYRDTGTINSAQAVNIALQSVSEIVPQLTSNAAKEAEIVTAINNFADNRNLANAAQVAATVLSQVPAKDQAAVISAAGVQISNAASQAK